MISVCLIKSLNKPWHNLTRNSFEKALHQDKLKRFKVTKIDTYPEENAKFDFIIVIGIKAIAKKILDGNRLKNNCNFLIDTGDHSLDPREGVEDFYFYFLPNK